MKITARLVASIGALVITACGGGGGDTASSQAVTPTTPTTQTPQTPTPTPPPVAVKPTSYENDKTMGLDPVLLPVATDTAAFARADFSRDGNFDLFIAYNPNVTSASDTTPGVFEFYAQRADGSYLKNANMIDNSVGCNNPRKAIVADFNGDKRPDVFVACHGIDVAPFPGEDSYIVLSMADGKYMSRKVGNIAFTHGATAADVDGDGDVDVLTASGGGLTLYKNDGQGVFTVDNTTVPTDLKVPGYYTVELIDTDGDGNLELLAGGHEFAPFNAPTVLVTNPFGTTLVSRTIPTVTAEQVVLDFTVHNGNVYLVRTGGGGDHFYGSNTVQKYSLSDGSTSVLYSKLTTAPLLELLSTSNGLVNALAKYPVTIPY